MKKLKFKNSQTSSFIKFNFQKSLRLTPLFYELLNSGAFKGNYYKYVHFSQESLIWAYKNKVSFYNVEMCINLLNKALRFLRAARKKKDQKFIFVGNPPKINNESKYIFHKIKIGFYGQNLWRPGVFSKNPNNCQRILIIYDIKTNYLAFSEAVAIKVPVVAFVTPNCDIRGVDYPVVLNLKNAGLAYAIFCKILIRK